MREIVITAITVLVLFVVYKVAPNPEETSEPPAKPSKDGFVATPDRLLTQNLNKFSTDELRILDDIVRNRANYSSGVLERSIRLNWSESLLQGLRAYTMGLYSRSSKINDEITRRCEQATAESKSDATNRPYQHHTINKLTEELDSLNASIAHFWEELGYERRGTGCDSLDSQSIEWQIFQLRTNLVKVNAELARRRAQHN